MGALARAPQTDNLIWWANMWLSQTNYTPSFTVVTFDSPTHSIPWLPGYWGGLLCTTDPSGSPDTVDAGAPAAEGPAAAPVEGAVPEGAVPEGTGPCPADAAAAAFAEVTSFSACAAAPPPHTESADSACTTQHRQRPCQSSLVFFLRVTGTHQNPIYLSDVK
jgi:hypothetical protein